MKFDLLLILVVLAGDRVFAETAENSDVTCSDEKERAKRILLEDNYYTILKRLDDLTNTTKNLESQVTSLKGELATRSHTNVAFKAHLTTSLPPLGPKQLIDFNQVKFNNGHAYHGGTFIAPYNGTYLFSVYICSPGGHWIVVDIMRNGSKIGQLMSGDDNYNDCSSQTIITELSAGDDVNVHHDTSRGGILGSSVHLNTFTGVLLDVTK